MAFLTRVKLSLGVILVGKAAFGPVDMDLRRVESGAGGVEAKHYGIIMNTPPPPRRWWKRLPVRLSVRAMMLLVLTFALALGGYVGFLRKAWLQQEVVSEIKATGGWVTYDFQLDPHGNGEPRAPKWLVDRLGVDFFGEIRDVKLSTGAKPVTPALLEKIGRLGRLRSLGASHVPSIDDESLAHLAGLANLEDLEIRATGVTGEGLVQLRHLIRLRNLDLRGLPLADADLAHLAGRRRLQSLSLDSPEVTDAGLAHLSHLTALVSLDLAGSGIRGEGLAHLGRMERLQSLDLTATAVDHLSALPQLPALERLSLGGSTIGDAGLAGIEKLPLLKELDLRDTMVADAGLRHLERLDHLAHLILCRTGISGAGAHSLARMKALAVLNLRATRITLEGVAELAANPSLARIDLWDTPARDGPNPDGMKALNVVTEHGWFGNNVGLIRPKQTVPPLQLDQVFTTRPNRARPIPRPPTRPIARSHPR
jgi:hypothetical protein